MSSHRVISGWSTLLQITLSKPDQSLWFWHSSCLRNSSVSQYLVTEGHKNQWVRCLPQASTTAQHLLGMDWIRLWITCTGMAIHFPGVPETTHTHLQGHSASNMSVQLVPKAFDWVPIWGHGRPGKSLHITAWLLGGLEMGVPLSHNGTPYDRLSWKATTSALRPFFFYEPFSFIYPCKWTNDQTPATF